MQTRTIVILDPTGQPKTKEVTQPPRIKKHTEKSTIGFLWNNKPNGDILLSMIKERLSRKLKLAGTIWQQKEILAAPAVTSIIEAFATADFVINAIAD